MPFMSMLIVLPNDCNGLPALQNALATFNLATFDNYMDSRLVVATIPKFKTKSSFTLNGPLEQVSSVKKILEFVTKKNIFFSSWAWRTFFTTLRILMEFSATIPVAIKSK